jgi:tripartite-type tricarboxylate transporter receptor subunit TctC
MACLAGLLINPAFAQNDYPARSVRIVVGFPPGGSSDVSARVVAERMSAEWKQPVIIENRPGASGTIAAAAVAASPADGYTLLHIGPGTHAITAALYRNLAYDAIKDFTGVGQIGIAPFAIVVGARSPLKTMKQLIEAARSRPGQLSFASSGNGTAPHLITESIASATGVKFFQIAYKGTAPSAMAAITGEVDFATVDSASALSHARSGQLRVLAITTALRSSMYPGVPTVAETAAPGFAYPSSVGLAAPAGTPREIVQRINGALNRALANEGVRDRLKALGFEAAPVSAQDFDAFIASEVDRYARVVRNLGLKME